MTANGDARDPWAWARAALPSLPNGGFNIAHAIDRHARGDALAFRFLNRQGEVQELCYAELALAGDRYAELLRGFGIGKGDAVALLLPRRPALYVAALGCLKASAAVAPVFAALGPQPIATRINLAQCRLLITTAQLYQSRVEPLLPRLPTLQHVLFAADGGVGLPGILDLAPAARADVSSAPVTSAEDLAFLHFTSATTGAPKAAMLVHEAAVAQYASAAVALDLRPGDIYWCTADPGWVTGTAYGIVAPLLHGATCIVDEADFDVARWYSILDQQQVNVWYTAPTAIRLLMKSALAPPPLPQLRLAASVGEPLGAAAAHWGAEALGVPIRDTWWQTETGAIMIANAPPAAVRPGAMGRPLPGVQAHLVKRREDGGVQAIDSPEAAGELAFTRGWPSMFRGYLHDDARYRRCFAGDLYLTGDRVRRDADGMYWFLGRADDVIKSSGHLIGPFEVESVLLEHPAVAEAAAIGLPDEVCGEVVKAYVTVRDGCETGEALRRELLAHARRRLGAALAPKEIAWADRLPHNRSGKIVRRVLRARELGLPEGDTSSLE
jgi:acetyl-CoA synthetase